MQNPTTPKNANEEILRLKQSLSAKWGIAFPPRDPNWSPSRQNLNQPEERISNCIQYLYFRNGALAHAIKEFEKNAVIIYSQWQFKPRSDPDVIPVNTGAKRPLEHNFLRKREELSNRAVKELTECLLHKLSQVRDDVKAGCFRATDDTVARYDLERTHVGSDSRKLQAENDRIPSIEGYPQIKFNSSKHQSSLQQWFRNKSAPGASTTHTNAAQHPSSDDYSDPEMAELFADPTLIDTSRPQTAVPPLAAHIQPLVEQKESTKSERLSREPSPVDEKFETPPTSPPSLRARKDGLGLSLAGPPDFKNPDALQHHGFSSLNRKRPYPDFEQMKPPPLRWVSREKKIDQPCTSFAMPTPPPDSYSLMSRPSSLTRSFDNSSSVSSSFTGVSPAWTSLNTSFCSDSMATSFDSAANGTDSTARPSKAQIRSKWPKDRSPPWNELNKVTEHYGDTVSMVWDAKGRGDTSLMMSAGTYMPVQHGEIDRTFEAIGAPALSVKTVTADIEKSLHELLISHPLLDPLPCQTFQTPFRQIYEVFRVSTNCAVPIQDFTNCFKNEFESYSQLWSALASTVIKSKGTPLPERSSLVAWDRAGDSFDGVALAIKLKILNQSAGPVFKLSLLPLKIESSYRLARKYGHDRFCVLLIPSLSSESFPPYLKSKHVAARGILIRWLVERKHAFLGRTWRAFYVKPEPTKKSQKGTPSDPNDARFRVHLFAEDGEDFQPEIARAQFSRCKSRVTVKQLIDWFMPSDRNNNQPSLKLFSRLGMGLTSTLPTLKFLPKQIIRSCDARSDAVTIRRLNVARSERLKTGRDNDISKSSVMNDGCARMSRDAAIAIANLLGMDETPSVFQGRIGGAKGVWMIDALDERPESLAGPDGKVYWIEITDSQLKYKPHEIDALFPDEARVTFEVNKFSKRLSSSSLNFQLMPILENRGVPQEVFKRLLREDLSSRVSEMEAAMDDGLALRKWNQDTNSVSHERARFGGIEMVGGLPESTAEIINWFVEHGFEPKSCKFLKDQLWKSIHSYCLRLENRMNIGLGRSTMAYMIADPLAILEEGEVHIGFSNMFRDTKSGFNENMLHDIDVLVARLPAHLPSDIQKVHAVFKPELRIYRDVVVFATKGEVSLASKLSGGDYDGDTAWICWDPDIVGPFQNAPVPEHPSLETYGIEKDRTMVADVLDSDNTDRFLCHAFDFNMQMNMLGICTKYHEALCYHYDTIDSPAAINIAVLLGNLVDSAKGGFRYDDARWTAYLKRLALRRNIGPPAYKDKMRLREKENNLIDQLVFHVAKEQREEALKNFAKHFENVSSWDEDLASIRKEEVEAAKTNRALDAVLKNLKDDLEPVFKHWRTYAKRDGDEEDLPPGKRGNALSFRSVVEKCREDFLAICPRPKGVYTRDWALLKASIAFFHFHKYTSFIWHTAGVELGEIKATIRGRGTYRPVVNYVHHTLKLDGKLVDGAKKRELQMEELRKAEEDDDEYGSDVDMSAF